jgi:hypothetical protein
MGQLIRAKKVAGQKVGRSWYIDEESLNAYLGKAPVPAAPRVVVPAPADELAPVAPAVIAEVAPAPAPAPIADSNPSPDSEPVPIRIVAENIPHSATPAPEIRAEAEAPGIERSGAQAESVEERVAPSRAEDQPVRAIYHAPYMEEREAVEWRETRIPVRASVPAVPEKGGLRYAAEDYAHDAMLASADAAHDSYRPAAAPRVSGSFPYKSLSFVALLATVAAVFASNFISTTIVSEQGKSAIVNHAIHW